MIYLQRIIGNPDHGWCWYPVVLFKSRKLQVQISGEKELFEQWDYEQAKALAEDWANLIEALIQIAGDEIPIGSEFPALKETGDA